MALRARDRSVAETVRGLGAVFATFDHRTQDSGNISYGVETSSGERLFLKTAGNDAPSPGGTSYAERVTALRRAAEVHRGLEHPALVRLIELVEAADGIVAVYEWFDGDLLRSPAEKREDPLEPGSRFRDLPSADIIAALDAIIDLHVALDRLGWVSGDLYDGCIMYDFDAKSVRFMDFEAYRQGPYLNEVGRLPGSDRFMAPEEYTKGELIDSRTTIFNLGKLIAWFLDRHEADSALKDLIQQATAQAKADRHQTMTDFQSEWRSATLG